MASAAAGCFGLVVGAILGAVLGVAVGFWWTTTFISCVDEGCGIVVLFGFMPKGAILGAIVGAITLVAMMRPDPSGANGVAGRKDREERPTADPVSYVGRGFRAVRECAISTSAQRARSP